MGTTVETGSEQTTGNSASNSGPDDILETSEQEINQMSSPSLVLPTAEMKVETPKTQPQPQSPAVPSIPQNGEKGAKTDTVLSQPKQPTIVAETVVAKPFDHVSEFKNSTVVLKPIPRRTFRLGLEQTQEKFTAVPGSTFRYAPKVVGNMFRTGLNRPEMGATPELRRERLAWLEFTVGRPLDAAFYGDMTIPLDRNTRSGERLHLEKAHDFIIYLSMLESDQIANGLHEYDNGTKPFAEFYIENREAQAEAKASIRQQSIFILQEFAKLSDPKKRNLASMAGVDVLGLSNLAVGNELWSWIDAEDEPKQKPVRQKLFLEWLNLGDAYINVSALTKNAIKFNIIRKNGAGDYFYGDAILGTSEAEVVGKLIKNTSGDLRLGIQSKVNAKGA